MPKYSIVPGPDRFTAPHYYVDAQVKKEGVSSGEILLLNKLLQLIQ